MTPVEAQTTLVTALVLVGAMLKHAVPSEAINRWIPLILVLAGTPIYCALVGAWGAPELLQGLIAAAGATGLHQTASKSTGLNL